MNTQLQKVKHNNESQNTTANSKHNNEKRKHSSTKEKQLQKQKAQGH